MLVGIVRGKKCHALLTVFFFFFNYVFVCFHCNNWNTVFCCCVGYLVIRMWSYLESDPPAQPGYRFSVGLLCAFKHTLSSSSIFTLNQNQSINFKVAALSCMRHDLSCKYAKKKKLHISHFLFVRVSFLGPFNERYFLVQMIFYFFLTAHNVFSSEILYGISNINTQHIIMLKSMHLFYTFVLLVLPFHKDLIEWV